MPAWKGLFFDLLVILGFRRRPPHWMGGGVKPTATWEAGSGSARGDSGPDLARDRRPSNDRFPAPIAEAVERSALVLGRVDPRWLVSGVGFGRARGEADRDLLGAGRVGIRRVALYRRASLFAMPAPSKNPAKEVVRPAPSKNPAKEVVRPAPFPGTEGRLSQATARSLANGCTG